MARIPASTRKPAGTIPVAPPPPKVKKGEETMILLPFPFTVAFKKTGLQSLLRKRGPGKNGNSRKLRALKDQLKKRQDCLRIHLKGRNLIVKKDAPLRELESAILGSPNAEFDVEMILNSKKEKGSLQYLVLWVDFPLEFASWVPADELKKCKNLVRKFHKIFKGKQGEPRFSDHEVLGDIRWEKDDSELKAEELDEDGNPKPKAAEAERDPNIDPILQGSVTHPRLGSGGAAAAAMQLIGPTPKVKKSPGTAPGTRKSERTPVVKYENLNDRGLSSGKIKMVKAGVIEVDTDSDDEVVAVKKVPTKKKTPARKQATLRPATSTGGKKSALGEYVDSNSEEDIQMMDTPTRKATGKHFLRHGERVVQVASDTESDSDEESELRMPVRKKLRTAETSGSRLDFNVTNADIEPESQRRLPLKKVKRAKIAAPRGSGPNRKSRAVSPVVEPESESESKRRRPVAKRVKIAAPRGSGPNRKSRAVSPVVEPESESERSRPVVKRLKTAAPRGSGPNRKSRAESAAAAVADGPEGSDADADSDVIPGESKHHRYLRLALEAYEADTAEVHAIYNHVENNNQDGDANGDDEEKDDEGNNDHDEDASNAAESPRVSPLFPVEDDSDVSEEA